MYAICSFSEALPTKRTSIITSSAGDDKDGSGGGSTDDEDGDDDDSEAKGKIMFDIGRDRIITRIRSASELYSQVKNSELASG